MKFVLSAALTLALLGVLAVPVYTQTPTIPPAGVQLQVMQTQIASLQQQVKAVAAIQVPQVPAGTIIAFAGTTPPPGWIPCDGRYLDKQGFQALFAAIGTTYGQVDATFRVPDLRGMFVRGWDSSPTGPDANRTFGSVQAAAVGSHSHVFSASATSNDVTYVHSNPIWGSIAALTHYSYTLDQDESFEPTWTTVAVHWREHGKETNYENWTHHHEVNVGGTTATNANSSDNRPINVSLIYLIKS